MRTITGDLVALAKDGAFDLIAHGCNCMCTMGAGIALPIRKTWPDVFDADLRTQSGDRAKLGTCTQAIVASGKLTVVNAYTQFDYRGDGVKVDYDAVARCMAWIKDNHSGKRSGLPKIGAGLAGGDWSRIEAIVTEELTNEDVTVVAFAG
ncbi:MAG: phosphatase [Pseudomonadota bacterium]